MASNTAIRAEDLYEEDPTEEFDPLAGLGPLKGLKGREGGKPHHSESMAAELARALRHLCREEFGVDNAPDIDLAPGNNRNRRAIVSVHVYGGGTNRITCAWGDDHHSFVITPNFTDPDLAQLWSDQIEPRLPESPNITVAPLQAEDELTDLQYNESDDDDAPSRAPLLTAIAICTAIVTGFFIFSY